MGRSMGPGCVSQKVEVANVDAREILNILYDDALAEKVSLNCLCRKGHRKWCKNCDARLEVVETYRKAVFREIERRLPHPGQSLYP